MRIPEIAERQRLRMRKYTDAGLLKTLVEQATHLGRTPRYREVKPDPKTYERRFGSYRNAILAAGLEPNVPLPTGLLKAGRRSISLSLRFAVLHRDGFRCQYCGGTPQDGYVLHVDHKVPASKGGTSEMGNLVTACFICNSGKSDSDL